MKYIQKVVSFQKNFRSFATTIFLFFILNLSMGKQRNYTYDEAFEASLKYFGGDELAARVWVNKYAMKDSFGNI